METGQLSLPQQPESRAELTRRWVGRTLLWLLLIVAIGYTAGNTDFLFNNEPIAIEVETPRSVTLHEGEQFAVMSVTAKIRNNTDEPVTLQAATPCHVFRWFIAAPNGEFVQSKLEENCAQLVMSAYLQPGEKAKEQIEIPLDPPRYVAGERYILVYRYWGYEDRVSFRVEAE